MPQGRAKDWMRRYFRAGRRRLKAIEPELLARGWTRARLYGIGQHAWPFGWGIAWSESWGDADLEGVRLRSDGRIAFVRNTVAGRVETTASPNPGGMRR